MVTQEEAVRAALELEAEYLDDLGMTEHAAAVRRRTPLPDIQTVPTEAPQLSERAEVSSSVESAARGASAGARRFADSFSGANYAGSARVLADAAVVTAGPHITGDGFYATLHSPDEFEWGFSQSCNVIPFDSSGYGIKPVAWSSRNFDDFAYSSAVLSILGEVLRDEWMTNRPGGFATGNSLTHFNPINRDASFVVLSEASRNLPLEQRMGIYHFLVHGNDPQIESLHGPEKARFLRLMTDVGDDLRLPRSSILYLISRLFGRRR